VSDLRSHPTNHVVSSLAALRIDHLDSTAVQTTGQRVPLKPAVEDDRHLVPLEPAITPY
jgi:hypothetical protein